MSNTTKTRIVRIGNSQGTRIPKVILDQLGLAGEVELSVQTDRLVIRSVRRRDKAGRKNSVKCTNVATIA